MRVFSFAQESTRYCNYSKNKFGNELTYIIPSWMDMEECSVPTSKNGWSLDHDFEFLVPLGKIERFYFDLLEHGWKPQQARQVLPNALKTELIMTGFVSDWKHFFELRDAESAHPDARYLAKPLHEEFIKRNYITNE